MKVIFFGTPEFAVPSLKAISEHHEVLAVVTQLDKPVGRKKTPVFSPVKQFAVEHGITVLQFEKVRRDGVEELKKLNADIMISCAYGQIFSKEILDITPYGMYNIHGSILPKYRGAAPIQWSIINGEPTCGITILKTDVGLDDGDILLKSEVEIKKYETSEELFERLSHVGAECIIKALTMLESGNFTLTPQDPSLATTCTMLKPELSKLDFNKSAQTLCNLIHGINPWPVAKVTIEGNNFKVFRAQVASSNYTGANGEVVVANNKTGLIVKCGDGAIEFTEIQPENGKRMTAKSYLNGKKINLGAIVSWTRNF